MAMWIAKLRIRHDCIIGKRCEMFQCTSLGYPLDFFKEGEYLNYFHFEKISGDPADIKRFIADLRKDKRIRNLETNNNLLFFTYRTKSKGNMPTQAHLKKVFHLKPVFVDSEGVEHWDVGSWKKESLMEFIQTIKQETEGVEEFNLVKIVKSKLKDIHFPHIMPLLSPHQDKALALAKKYGYYEFPRKIDLRELANMMGISLSTYREHLRKAERTVLKGL